VAQILDYSGGYPPAKEIRDRGYVGVIRYLRKEGISRVKPITVDEMRDLATYGCDVALVYQHVRTSRVTEGRAAGVHDAHWALDRAHELGVGEPRALYFAVDFDATPSAIDPYFRGTLDVVGVERNGVYGNDRVLRYLLDRELVSYGWQTAAWSGGRREPRAHLFQRVGSVTVGDVPCDVNDVLKADYGQFSFTAIDGDDMEWTDQIEHPHVPDPARPGHGVLIVAKDAILLGNDAAQRAEAGVQRLETSLAALTAAVSDGDLDAEAVLARVDAAVREATDQAVTTRVLPALRDVVRDVLGDDNDDQATAIVDQLAERLRATGVPEGE
jgi:hypothetical protein